MACTTIIVGKKASYDGSTLIARNDDNPSGQFAAKKVVYVDPSKQPKIYKSKISKVTIQLPDNPIGYTMTPTVDTKNGVWPACGINKENVTMTATETITSNPLVLAGDPLVEYIPNKTKMGGIGEEDIVVLVLPYIKTAKEGVYRLGKLLEEYGTYESNGIVFADKDDVWYLETIGGHHFIAVRLKDDHVSVIPNQLFIDNFDFEDGLGKQENYICSKDMLDFIKSNHIDLSLDSAFNPRISLGSHSDSDHVYNTPRAWFGVSYFNKDIVDKMQLTPTSDNIPFSVKPLNKVTIEDVKYVLASYYQGTPYNQYSKINSPEKGIYRPIGINRTSTMCVSQIRGYLPKQIQAIQWVSFACNVFNTFIPIYTNVDTIPTYLSNTTSKVNTNNFYWQSRLCSVLGDMHFNITNIYIERYQNSTMTCNHEIINKYDKLYLETKDVSILAKANKELSDLVQNQTDKLLDKLLYETSMKMKNSFSRSDN